MSGSSIFIMSFFCFFFLFQAEDGIRDLYVPGVQTCALPISLGSGDPVGLTYLGGAPNAQGVGVSSGRDAFERVVGSLEACEPGGDATLDRDMIDRSLGEIGRASCRERG